MQHLSQCDGKLTLKEEGDGRHLSRADQLLVQEALHRRGIALQFAGICSYCMRDTCSSFSMWQASCHQRTSVQQIVTTERAGKFEKPGESKEELEGKKKVEGSRESCLDKTD